MQHTQHRFLLSETMKTMDITALNSLETIGPTLVEAEVRKAG